MERIFASVAVDLSNGDFQLSDVEGNLDVSN